TPRSRTIDRFFRFPWPRASSFALASAAPEALMSKARRFASFLRAHVAGFEASSVQAFARHLHARLGRRFLPEATKWALRQGIERGVETSLRTEIVNVSSASRSLAHELANHGAMQL